MADNFGVYNLTGRVEPVISSSLETALQPISGNINIRRLPQKSIYNRLLLGTALRSEVGEQPLDSSPATVPSWTQVEAEKKHAFVIGELSSSDHMLDIQNSYLSGVFPLEFSAVPASGAFYYSKQRRLVQKIFKLSASAGMTVNPAIERQPSAVEYYPRGTFQAVSGSFRNNSYFAPAVFEIDVPDYGKIRDIKVWVELIHDTRKGPWPIVSASAWGGTGDANFNRRQGLQGLQIALQSPNTSFANAHPLWNDEQVKEKRKNPDPAFPERYKHVPDLLKNSYLLWAGHSVEQDLGQTLQSYTGSLPDQFYDLSIVTTGLMGDSNSSREMTLETDKENRPHVAFMKHDGVIYRLYHAKLGATAWQVTSVFAGTGTIKAGLWNKIRINAANQPRIGHVSNNGGSATVVYFSYSNDDGATWVTETVATISSFSGCDMALSIDDVPYIIYSTFDSVFVAKRTGAATWKIERVFYGDFGGQQDGLGIALDSTVRPHVVFSLLDELNLRHAYSGSNGWFVEKFPFPDAQWLEQFQCVIDSSDALHVAGRYNEISGLGNTQYFRSSSLGWYSASLTGPHGVDVDGEGGQQANIFLNKKSGYPAVSWWHYRNLTVGRPTQIRIAELGPYGFTTRIAGVSSQNAPHPGAAIDYLGNQHAVWFSGSSGIVYSRTKNSVITTGGGFRIVPGGSSSSLYHSFNHDIDMRTIFTDSSNNLNPRHTRVLYRDGTVDFPTLKLIKEGCYHSPSSASLLTHFKYSNFPLVLNTDHFMTGTNFPWMLDDRIPPGAFDGRNFSFATSSDGIVSLTSSFPTPTGWLTGPGDTADVNEWPTKGMSLGPNDIRPVYPLLDDVYVEKIYDEPSKTSTQTVPAGHGKIIGFRPGLRGTEVNGKWKLLIGNNAHHDGVGGMTGSIRDGWWFRQFRLEFLIDQGEELRGGSYASKNARFKKHDYVAAPAGKRLYEIVSGSAAWDIGTNHVLVIQPEEYGRSIGIVSVTGAADFAVFSQLTGALPGILSASGLYDQVQSTYLSNEFGTPYIPLSSGSAEIPSFDVFDIEEAKKSRLVFDQVLNPKTLIPKDNTLRASLARADIVKSTRDFILTKIGKG